MTAEPAGARVEGCNQQDLYRSSKIFEAVRGYINLKILSSATFFLPSSPLLALPHFLTLSFA